MTIFDPDGDVIAWPWEADPIAPEASHRRSKTERRLGKGSTKKLKSDWSNDRSGFWRFGRQEGWQDSVWGLCACGL